MNFFADLRRLPAALVGWHLSWTSALYFTGSAFFLATVTHTAVLPLPQALRPLKQAVAGTVADRVSLYDELRKQKKP